MGCYQALDLHLPTSLAPSTRLMPPWLPSFLVPACGGCLFGYDIGAVGSVLHALGTGASALGPMSALQLGWVASGALVGALVACALLMAVGDGRIGRTTELKVCCASAFGVHGATNTMAS